MRRVSCRGEELGEVVSGAQRAMRVVGHGGRFGEAPVVVGHELGKERGGGDGIVEAAQPQLFDEPVLQGAVGPFDPPLGFGTARAEEVDVELPQGAPEL